jgi:hypothetical protein
MIHKKCINKKEKLAHLISYVQVNIINNYIIFSGITSVFTNKIGRDFFHKD